MCVRVKSNGSSTSFISQQLPTHMCKAIHLLYIQVTYIWWFVFINYVATSGFQVTPTPSFHELEERLKTHLQMITTGYRLNLRVSFLNLQLWGFYSDSQACKYTCPNAHSNQL